MIRWLFFLVALGLAVFGAYWLTLNSGSVTLQWLGYQVDTSVAFLLVVVLVIALVTAARLRVVEPRLGRGGRR